MGTVKDERFEPALICNSGQCPTDFTIHCGDRERDVHRLIFSASSRFFEKLCYGGFKEDKEACIYLNVDDPKDIARMIKFFYAERYTDESEKRDDVIEFSMLVHARMLALADKYQSPPLMDFAGFSLSYKAAETKTKKEDRVIFDQIIEEVPFVYSNTSCSEDKLRLLLVDGMHMTGPLEGHRGCLKEHGSKDDWLKIFQEVPEFGAELMSYSSQLFAAEEAERFDENDPWAVGG